MNKLTLAFGITAAAAVALAAGLWFSWPEDQSRKLIALEQQLREAQGTIVRLTRERATVQSRSDPLSSIGEAATDGTVPSSQPRADGKAGSSSNAPEPNRPSGDGTTLMPAAKTNKRLAEAEARYAEIIDHFKLQPDEKEAFKTMLAKRDDIRKEASSKLMDPSQTTAQRQAILAAAKTQLDDVDGSIRQFLNDDNDFTTFQKWQNQELERNQVEAGRAIFQNSGVPLNEEQQTWLTDQMWALRQDTKGLGDPYYLETMTGARIDATYVRNSLGKFDNDTAILLQNARSRMSAPQLEALRSMRVQLRVQLESRLWNLERTTGGR